MALETGDFINDLEPTNPAGADPIAQGDDHIRLLKKVIKANFPDADRVSSLFNDDLTPFRSEQDLLRGLYDYQTVAPGNLTAGKDMPRYRIDASAGTSWQAIRNTGYETDPQGFIVEVIKYGTTYPGVRPSISVGGIQAYYRGIPLAGAFFLFGEGEVFEFWYNQGAWHINCLQQPNIKPRYRIWGTDGAARTVTPTFAPAALLGSQQLEPGYEGLVRVNNNADIEIGVAGEWEIGSFNGCYIWGTGSQAAWGSVGLQNQNNTTTTGKFFRVAERAIFASGAGTHQAGSHLLARYDCTEGDRLAAVVAGSVTNTGVVYYRPVDIDFYVQLHAR